MVEPSPALRVDLAGIDSALMHEIGSTGLRAFGGYIREEFLPALQWPQAGIIYREMSENDPIVSAMLTTHDLLTRQVAHHVEPADESPLAAEIADFCQSAMDDMEDTWQEHVSSILSMLPFGFSVHEEVFKRRRGMDVTPEPAKDQDGKDVLIPGVESKYTDGKIGWRGLPIRGQDTIERWQYTSGNRHYLLGAHQRTMTDPPVTLPMSKLLHFRTSALKANPLGKSILRGAYRAWYFKRRIEEIEGIGIERDLAGLPVAYVPSFVLDPEAPPNIKNLLRVMQDAVKNTRRNEAEGLVMPGDRDEHGNRLYDFELLSTGSRRAFDTGAVITRYDQRILTTALADFILLGHEGVGTLGVTFGTTKVDLFAAALDAVLNQIDAEFSDVAFPRLVRLNGWPVELSPTLKHGEVQSVDLKEIAELIFKMSQSGFTITPDHVLQDHVLDTAGLPHTPAEELARMAQEVELEVQRRVAAEVALQQTKPGDEDEVEPGGETGEDELDEET